VRPLDDYRALLGQLRVGGGDVVYVHTSYSRLARLGVSVSEIIEGLLDAVGRRGTVVMPSFAWNLDRAERPWKGYADYFRTRPVFDVVNTTANIGLVPEQFRARADVRRSMSYWWPVCAAGAHARELTEGQEHVEHPYGSGSTFDRLRILGAKVLGLGVSLNTNSLALTVDHALGVRHPHQVFTSEPMAGTVVDFDGRSIQTWSIWLLPEVVRTIKPSAVIAASPTLQASIARADRDDSIYFSYVYDTYHAEALHLADAAIRDGRRLPWLADYPRRSEADGPSVVRA
jgi:aminoglycoside N3'-acetyltransferase